MFKSFYGAQKMLDLQRQKLQRLMSREGLMSRLIKIAIASITMITLWAMPTSA